MINLKTATGRPKTFDSPIWTHPQQAGSSYVDYTVNHNFGEHPSTIFGFYNLTTGGHTEWPILYDYSFEGSTAYGWLQLTSATKTSMGIRVFYIGGAAYRIKFRCGVV